MDYNALLEVMGKAVGWSRKSGNHTTADILADGITAIKTLKTELAGRDELCRRQRETIRELQADIKTLTGDKPRPQ